MIHTREQIYDFRGTFAETTKPQPVNVKYISRDVSGKKRPAKERAIVSRAHPTGVRTACDPPKVNTTRSTLCDTFPHYILMRLHLVSEFEKIVCRSPDVRHFPRRSHFTRSQKAELCRVSVPPKNVLIHPPLTLYSRFWSYF